MHTNVCMDSLCYSRRESRSLASGHKVSGAQVAAGGDHVASSGATEALGYLFSVDHCAAGQ